jgi:RHH-type proline utilization regulon transcriptional repressor/proline dehydrogenase/delta 1-pyrroline-5-carboxylate dehydrogenase
VVGHICQAGPAEVSKTIAVAKGAFPAWRDTDPRVRADCLFRAAAAARRRTFELAAWQVLEIGKQWDQAYADVTEAIDFLEYYGREMVRLGEPMRAGSAPGELNHYLYEPRGVAAVIAPWNFPLAISMGMASAALVTGNCVVYKPSGLTPVIGRHLAELFREAGLPPGVFNYLPGRGSEIGDLLVENPDVSLIAFTGSREVGLRIIEHAAVVHPGQEQVKRVVCEMGGKNAIIVDDDADLDEAVPHIIQSAFGFQGQKCSACSRVIVLDAIYDAFVGRLVAMARATRVGPAEDPGCFMGAVAEEAAVRRIREYAAIGKEEGTLLYEGPVPEEGYYVPMTIIGGITPAHRVAQEEIFGPVLAVMRAKDFDQAIVWANSTRYALTGGVFSRSPAHLARARREFRVGNLYLNRGITGALVERQPFGGARMSGVGTKAGGPDYLRHFMDPRVITENTMRRGFAPAEGDNGPE